MNKNVSVLIVDDHPAMAYGTKMLLEDIPGVRVCGIAGSGERGLELAARERPEIVFLDYNLPDVTGAEAAAELKRLLPETHIVIFSGFDLVPMYNSLLSLEISGVISKDAGEEQLKNMVRCLLEGQTALPIALFRQLSLQGEAKDQGDSKRIPLTEEEMHIMELIAQGATNEQIADDIHMSKRSVDNYVRKIYDKFGVKSRAQAIERYIQSFK
jgi:two-component system competent response regulator ComA